MYLSGDAASSTANNTISIDESNGALMAPAVLLIEPDLATRQLYTRALQQRWQVTAVRDVAEATAALAAGLQVQAAVIEPYADDHQIDWMQLALLRDSFPGQLPAPVVLCSTLDERRSGYAWGAALYLLKPVSPEQLVAELARLLH